MIIGNRGFGALVATQALGAFSQNMLRATLLTLVAFRPLDTGGLGRETVAALSTLFIVAPYAMLSLPAGRLADRMPKSNLIQAVKLSEIPVFVLAALGLLSGHVGLVLAALLLAGVCAALLGPAKFGIIPDLVEGADLISGNAWISATSTLAILGGLIAGNLLALSAGGLSIVAYGGVFLTVIAAGISQLIPRRRATAPEVSLHPQAFVADFADSVTRVRQLPAIILPILGCSWFWFQGTVSTSLIPLYVAEGGMLHESVVSVMLVAASLGVTAGAVAAHLLSRRSLPFWFPPAVLCVTAAPGLDLWLAAPLEDSVDLVRAVVDLTLISAGCGLFVVPLGAAVQHLTPPGERARFVGINHTCNGLAMILAGAALLLLNLPGISAATLFAGSALISGAVAAATMVKIWPRLQARPPSPKPMRLW